MSEKTVRAANGVVSIFTGCLMAVLFLYGGYSLWDTWRIYHGAFVDDELMELKPVKGEDANPSLQDLQNINADVCAWLTIDDTGIDYPVVRGKDDMEYINKDVYGNFALSGSIFLSSANQPDFTDPYNLIYGHHMSNGAMFGDVVEFTDDRHIVSAGGNQVDYNLCLRGGGSHRQTNLWLYRRTGHNRADAGTFILCEGTCCAVSGYPGDRGRFRCCPVHLCGVCHKRKGGVIRKIGEGF